MQRTGTFGGLKCPGVVPDGEGAKDGERHLRPRAAHLVLHPRHQGGLRGGAEDRPHEGAAGGSEVLLQADQEIVHLRLALHIVQGVYAHHGDNPGGGPGGGRQRDGAAHRVPHQDHVLEVERLHHAHDVVAERFHRPVLAPGPRLAVAGKVEGHDAVSGRERLQDSLPERAVAPPAVDEQECRLPGSGQAVGDGHPVGRRDLARPGGARCREPGGGRDRSRSGLAPHRTGAPEDGKEQQSGAREEGPHGGLAPV